MTVISWLMRRYGKVIKARHDLLPYYQRIEYTLGVPIELVVAHAEQESNQKYLAVGALDEYGLWQFLPSTWRAILGSADWKSVRNQTEAYIKHTEWIIKKYKLNLHNTEDKKIFLWIWNAGSGNYQKGNLPASTKQYIKNILKMEEEVWL